MVFKKFIEDIKERRNEKNLTKEQKEKFKKERIEVLNLIDQLSDKGKKYCMELLTKTQFDLHNIKIEWDDKKEMINLKKILNTIKEWNYGTKAWVVFILSTKYNIESILLYGAHNVGDNIEHDLKTFKNIERMDDNGRTIHVNELNEDGKIRAEEIKRKEAIERKRAINSQIKKFLNVFHKLSDEGKKFCIVMLKKSSSFLLDCNVIRDNKENLDEEETKNLEKAHFYIIVLDDESKNKLLKKLPQKYGIHVDKKSDYNGPRKLSKKKKSITSF